MENKTKKNLTINFINNAKIKLMIGVTTIIIATSGGALTNNVHAETVSNNVNTRVEEQIQNDDQLYFELKQVAEQLKKDNHYGKETFFDINDEYMGYVANEKDNLSVISTKICKKLNIELKDDEYTTRYWPVLAKYNPRKRESTIVVPNQVIIFPNSEEKLNKELFDMKTDGSLKRIIAKNHVYESKVDYSNWEEWTVRQLVQDVYGHSETEFVKLFIEIAGLSKYYTPDMPMNYYIDGPWRCTDYLASYQQMKDYLKEKEKTGQVADYGIVLKPAEQNKRK